MSCMKCPFCNGELVGTIGHPICRNQNCVMCDDPMPQELLHLLERTSKALDKEKKENKDKQAVLNCVVDMLKLLNQKYTLIMGKDVIKETVRLVEQKDK